jgi:DHA2 family multidrug resistance protein-like MFS transporter
MTSAQASAASSAAGAPEEDGLPQPRRLWAVLAISLAVVLSVLDSALLNVALPTLAQSLAISPATSVWIINAYQLAIIASLLPLAALGEQLGYRRIFRCGVWLFTLSSLACALAPNIQMLVLARITQGLGASAAMCCSAGLLRYCYPAALFGRGIARNTFFVTMSAAAGPTVCAAVLAVADWPWLFALNLPVGLLALLAARHLPATPRQPRHFDLYSLLLNAGGMCLGILGVAQLAQRSWSALALIGAAVLAIALLVRRSQRQSSPLLPLDLLRIARFRWAISASLCMFATQSCALVALPFYLQLALGRSVLQTGLIMTAWAIGASFTNLLIGQLIDRLHATTLCLSGSLMLLAGLLGVVLMPSAGGDGWLLATMLLAGIGFGCFQAPNNNDMLTAPPRVRSGAAGGMQATARVNGQTWGAALAGLSFTLSQGRGALAALLTAIVLATLALVINGLRQRRLR